MTDDSTVFSFLRRHACRDFSCYGDFRSPKDEYAHNDGGGVRRAQFQVSLRRIKAGCAASLHDAETIA
jgi:hypothetical protein